MSEEKNLGVPGAVEAPVSTSEKAARHAAWPWWYSRDEERYSGPFASRSDAILEAWAEDELQPIFIIQATHGDVNCAVVDGDQLAELFDDANEEASDPDGDRLSGEISKAEWDAIAKATERAIRAAVRKHGVAAWSFAEQTGVESIDVSNAAIVALPADARWIVADLAKRFQSEFPASEYWVKDQIKRLEDVLRPVSATPSDTHEVG